MKSLPKLIITAAMTTILATGCEREWRILEVDYYFGENFIVSVEDSEGRNLLDSADQSAISSNNITIEYRDSTYVVDNSADHIWGESVLRVEALDKNDPKIILKFGEFFPEYDQDSSDPWDFLKQSFTINWGDDTSDEVEFIYSASWSLNKYPKKRQIRHEATRHYEVWLNGEKQPSSETLSVRLIR